MSEKEEQVDINQRLGQLRFLLYRAPGGDAWGALCRELERWPIDGQTEMLCSYAQELLEAWPDDIRQIPEDWIVHLEEGRQVPWWTLCRCFRTRVLHREVKSIRVVSTLPVMGAVTWLDLSEKELAVKAWNALWSGRYLSQVHTVQGVNAGVSSRRVGHLCRASLPALKVLDLSRNALRASGVRILASPDVERWPHLRTVRLVACQLNAKAIEALAQAPWLRELELLDLSPNKLGNKGIAQLAQVDLEGKSSLKHLVCRNVSCSAEGANVLWRAPWLEGLESLDLSQNMLGTMDHYALLHGNILQNVKTLNLEACRLHDKGLIALAKHSNARKLRNLDLSRNGITALGLAQLLRSPLMLELETLNLSHNRLGDEGCALIARAEACKRIVHVNVSNNGITARGFEALLGADELGSLRSLEINENHLHGVNWRVVQSSEMARGLVRLHLQQCELLTRDFIAFAKFWRSPKLTALLLEDNRAGVGGARALAECEGLSELRELVLHRNILGDKGAEMIAASTYLSRLEVLGLRENQIGDRGAVLIGKSQAFPALKRLEFGQNRLSYTGEEALDEAMNAREGCIYTMM